MKVQIIKNSKIQIICTSFLTFLARTETVSYPVFNFNELTYRLKMSQRSERNVRMLTCIIGARFNEINLQIFLILSSNARNLFNIVDLKYIRWILRSRYILNRLEL